MRQLLFQVYLGWEAEISYLFFRGFQVSIEKNKYNSLLQYCGNFDIRKFYSEYWEVEMILIFNSKQVFCLFGFNFSVFFMRS